MLNEVTSPAPDIRARSKALLRWRILLCVGLLIVVVWGSAWVWGRGNVVELNLRDLSVRSYSELRIPLVNVEIYRSSSESWELGLLASLKKRNLVQLPFYQDDTWAVILHKNRQWKGGITTFIRACRGPEEKWLQWLVQNPMVANSLAQKLNLIFASKLRPDQKISLSEIIIRLCAWQPDADWNEQVEEESDSMVRNYLRREW